MTDSKEFSSGGQEQPVSRRAPAEVLANISTELRAAIDEAFEAGNNRPDQRRMRRLREEIESGKVSGIRDGEWVAQCYDQKDKDGEPVEITKADVGSRAIVLTIAELFDITSLAYIDANGELQVFDGQMMEEGGAETIVVFPDEVGGHRKE